MNRKKYIIGTVLLLMVLGSSISTQRIDAAQSPGNTISLSSTSFTDNPIDSILNSVSVIQTMQMDGDVTNSALNDLASQLTSLSFITITDKFELLQLGAVVNYADTLLDTITVTTDNSEGYNNAKAAIETARTLIDYLKNNDSYIIDYTDNANNAVTPVPSVTPAPSFAPATSVTPTPSLTPATTITPAPTKKIKAFQMNYREDTLTVEDVKSWNWEEGGTIQVGGFLCEFGKSKVNGFLLIQEPHLQNYKTSTADIIVAKDQWEDLPEFKYGKYKYKTSYGLWTHMLKRTTKMTLLSSDPDRPIAIAGDTFVDKKGKKTKLTALKYDGDIVVGYGQKLDLFSGMKYEDGVFKPDDAGISWYGDNQYLNSSYFVASNGEGHFRWDWYIIWSYEVSMSKKVKKPKANQICGYWTQYNAKKKTWDWTGPEFDK